MSTQPGSESTLFSLLPLIILVVVVFVVWRFTKRRRARTMASKDNAYVMNTRSVGSPTSRLQEQQHFPIPVSVPIDNPETISDGKLMWQANCDGIERTQQEAFQYCSTLRLGGHSDWRLPALAEFHALARNLEAQYSDYWTSSSEPQLQSNVAYIDDGTTMFRTNKYFVRAVRSLTRATATRDSPVMLEVTPLLRDSIPEYEQEGIFGDGAGKLVDETPDYKIRKGQTVQYCGVRNRSVGESGQVLEVYSDGACVVRWNVDGTVGLYGDHLISKD